MRNDSKADRLAHEYPPAQLEGDAVVALAGKVGRTPPDEDAVSRLHAILDSDPSVALAGRLDWSPKKNWVENAGGLPKYIEDIALGLIRDGKMDRSRAIATAISRVKVWAAGGGGVKPDTRAKAAKALAEWEKLKVKNKGKQAKKAVKKNEK